jgi:hypothetical protein
MVRGDLRSSWPLLGIAQLADNESERTMERAGGQITNINAKIAA